MPLRSVRAALSCLTISLVAALAFADVACVRPDAPCRAERGCPAVDPFPACAASAPDVTTVAGLAARPPAPGTVVTVAGRLVMDPAHCTLLLCPEGSCCNGCGAFLALVDPSVPSARLAVGRIDEAHWRCGGDTSLVCCEVPTDVDVELTGVLEATPGSPDAPRFIVASACAASAPAPVTYRVPTRLVAHLDGDALAVGYGPEDTEPFVWTAALGTRVGARVRRDDGTETLGGVRPLAPPDASDPLDRLVVGRGPSIDRTYTLELFETAVPVEHHWIPTAAGYRVVWTRTFSVHVPGAAALD